MMRYSPSDLRVDLPAEELLNIKRGWLMKQGQDKVSQLCRYITCIYIQTIDLKTVVPTHRFMCFYHILLPKTWFFGVYFSVTHSHGYPFRNGPSTGSFCVGTDFCTTGTPKPKTRAF